MDALSIWEKMPNKTKKHAKRVKVICEEFAELYKIDEDKIEILGDAALLHDIGKKYNNEIHDDEDFVKSLLKEHDYDGNIAHVANIISCHKKNFYPRNNLHILAAILNISDKLDKYNKGQEDASEKCEKSMGIIKNNLNKNEFVKFEEIYKKIKSRVLDGLYR